MSQHVKSQNHVMSLKLSSIFFIFCPTSCFPPSDCKWPSLLCLILLCKQIAPLLATQNKIHRLSEVEAQLTELEDHLEDVHMTRVVQQVSVLRLQLRPIKAQLRVQLTIQWCKCQINCAIISADGIDFLWLTCSSVDQPLRSFCSESMYVAWLGKCLPNASARHA